MDKNKIFVIDDVYQIAEQMIDVADSQNDVVAVGYYDTIQELFNILIKADDDYAFIGGQLEPEEWDNYDEAWYIRLSNNSDIYTGKMWNEYHDRYFDLCADWAYIEEDFADQYFESNNTTVTVIFGFDDVHDTDEDEEDDSNTCLCMDKDQMGFTFCATNEYGHHKLKYRGNKQLTEEQAWDIVAENFGE